MKYLRVLTHYGSGWRDFVDALAADDRFALIITEDRERFVDNYEAIASNGDAFSPLDPSAYSEEQWASFYMDPFEQVSNSLGAAYSDKWMVHIMFASSGVPSMPSDDGEQIAFVRDPCVSWPFVTFVGITPKMLAYAAATAVKGLSAPRIVVHSRLLNDASHDAETAKLTAITGFDVSLDLFPVAHGDYVTETEAMSTTIRPYKPHSYGWEEMEADAVWNEIKQRASYAVLATGTADLTLAEFEASRTL